MAGDIKIFSQHIQYTGSFNVRQLSYQIINFKYFAVFQIIYIGKFKLRDCHLQIFNNLRAGLAIDTVLPIPPEGGLLKYAFKITLQTGKQGHEQIRRDLRAGEKENDMLYSEKLRPFAAAHPCRTIDVDGAQFRYILTGKPEGRTLVFLNGGMNTLEMWMDYVDALADTGRVLLFDYPQQLRTNQALVAGMHAFFAALKGKILLILPDQDFFSEQMQQDLIRLMHEPEIRYVSGGHLSTVLKTEDYIRTIRAFLAGQPD